MEKSTKALWEAQSLQPRAKWTLIHASKKSPKWKFSNKCQILSCDKVVRIAPNTQLRDFPQSTDSFRLKLWILFIITINTFTLYGNSYLVWIALRLFILGKSHHIYRMFIELCLYHYTVSTLSADILDRLFRTVVRNELYVLLQKAAVYSCFSWVYLFALHLFIYPSYLFTVQLCGPHVTLNWTTSMSLHLSHFPW